MEQRHEIWFSKSEDREYPVRIGFNSFTGNIPEGSLSFFVNWHNELELIYCTGGQGQFLCSEKNFPIKKGEVAVFNSNEVHQLLPPDEPFEYYYILISYDYCRENGVDLKFCTFHSLIQDEAFIKQLDFFIHAYKAKEEPFGVLKLRQELIHLLTRLVTHHITRHLTMPDENDRIAKIAGDTILYLEEHFTEKITIEDVSRHLNISRYYLSRVFKKYTGFSIITYTNRLRCSHARKLLLENRYTVTEICQLCGFSNVSYFDKVYQERYKYPPSQTRMHWKKRENRLKETP